MAAKKTTHIRIIKYFETRDPKSGEKYCFSPSDQVVPFTDQALLKELLAAGLVEVVEADQAEPSSLPAEESAVVESDAETPDDPQDE